MARIIYLNMFTNGQNYLFKHVYKWPELSIKTCLQMARIIYLSMFTNGPNYVFAMINCFDKFHVECVQ